MPREPSEPLWPVASRRALARLLERVRRTVLAYREAEQVVQDHRVQAAIFRLRLDHERHAAELGELLGSMPAVANDGAAEHATADPPQLDTHPATGDSDPSLNSDGVGAVHEAVQRGEASGAALLAALRRAERVLHAAYAEQAEVAHPEAVRVVLARHRRVEEAHVDWVHDSPIWPAGPVPDTRPEPRRIVPHGYTPDPPAPPMEGAP